MKSADGENGRTDTAGNSRALTHLFTKRASVVAPETAKPATNGVLESQQSDSCSEQRPLHDGAYPRLEIHGLHELFGSHTTWSRKLFFGCAITLSAIAAGISVFTLVDEFHNHSRATKIDMKRVNSLVLPKVTICNVAADVFDEPKLWSYLRYHFPNESAVTNETLTDLVGFIVAGSGFQKMRDAVRNLSDGNYFNYVNELYMKLRGSNKAVDEFFREFFGEYGYQCQQLFKSCRLGRESFNCCEQFEPSFVMRRGKCMSMKPMYQTRADELGQLGLEMNLLHTFLVPEKANILVFVHEHTTTDIAPFPRYYMKRNHYNKMRLAVTQIMLMEDSSETDTKCGQQPYGKGTCYLNQALAQILHARYGCSVPYWPLNDPARLPSCEPKLMNQVYNVTVDISELDYVTGLPCVPPCERWNYVVTWEDQLYDGDFKGDHGYDFLLEIAFTDLQYSQIREVRTLSFWGLGSQIGGQLGLFLGGSLISLIQLILILILIFKRRLFDRQTAVSKTDGNVAPPSNTLPATTAQNGTTDSDGRRRESAIASASNVELKSVTTKRNSLDASANYTGYTYSSYAAT